jgi:hypothetical protein
MFVPCTRKVRVLWRKGSGASLPHKLQQWALLLTPADALSPPHLHRHRCAYQMQAVRAQIVLNIAGRVDSQGKWLGGGCLELAMTDPGGGTEFHTCNLNLNLKSGTPIDAKEVPPVEA